MQTLIDDLLEFSRVRTQTKPLSQTSLDGIVARATADLAPLIAETNATIRCAALPSVPCDGDQMTRLFESLISNPIKFRSAEPPQIVVEASLDEQECVMSVRDNGIGIDPKFAKRIFMIFQRLHTREEYPGSGMGLAICRQIIECHGGRIWVEPAAGHGSTFKFSLPVVNQVSQREAS
jgi:chemotaxis family two-component system sensor kinase Cph1